METALPTDLQDGSVLPFFVFFTLFYAFRNLPALIRLFVKPKD